MPNRLPRAFAPGPPSCHDFCVTMDTNIGPSSLGNTNRPDRAALRHMNKCCGLILCRRATSLTTAPGAYDSATIRLSLPKT